MVHRILADLVALAHFAFILFAIFGGLLALRWRWIPWLHLPALIWGVAIELAGWYCPLTPLENTLRRSGGGEGYAGGFVERYLLPVIYPTELTRTLQIWLGILLLAFNLVVYVVLWRRRRIVIVATLLLVSSSPPAFAARDIAGTPTELFFLHPFLNYAPPPAWRQAWERIPPGESGLRISVGSVATDEFLTDFDLRLEEPVADGWRLLYHLRWLEALHLDVDEQQHFIGLEREVAGPLAVHLLAHPSSDKAELDIRAGVLLSDDTGGRYLRLSVRWEDPLFEEKNERNGRSRLGAVGPQWALRWAAERWELYSEGRYLSWSRRDFPDLAASPEIEEEGLRSGWSETRLRWTASSDHAVEARLFHQGFAEELRERDLIDPDRYTNRIVQGALTYQGPRFGPWFGRLEVHRVRQDVRIDDSDHRRREVLLGATAGWAPARGHELEFALMATRFRWETEPASPRLGPDQDGWATKLGLAWTHQFRPGTRFRFGLSHEPDPDRFGGANIQFQTGF